MSTPVRAYLFRRPAWSEAQFVARALRTETVGGALLLLAAGLAIAWANSPWHEAYAALRDAKVGPDLWHLRLSLGHWAADGLLALFFFVAGLEVKREFLVGDLRTPRKAALPVVAAFCGVAVPALLYTGVVRWTGGSAKELSGWAIPTATDIAFALAVLAVLGSALPSALRSFLLTLAVVDDLVAITIIAIFYTSGFAVEPLLLALVPLALFAGLTQRRITHWWLLVPLALLTWGLVHASGVHATVAGVLLGLVVPVRPRERVPVVSTLDASTDVAHRFEHRLRPLSAGVAVPVFAFFAAGVSLVGGGTDLGSALTDRVVLAVVIALVAGKLVGVLGSTWVMARLTRSGTDDEDNGVRWIDVTGLALLTGIGFTVSLLVGELTFAGTEHAETVKLGVLAGSVLAALLAAVVLVPRNAHFKRVAELEAEDADDNDVPDVYEQSGPVDKV